MRRSRLVISLAIRACAGTLSCAVVTVGCQSGETHRAWPSASAARGEDAPPALAYEELRNVRRGPNASMHPGISTELEGRIPQEGDVPLPTDQDHDRALAERAAHRAYDGAPPTVPHEVAQSTMDCVGCHTRGGMLAGRVAPRMSHRAMPSCTQCHVPETTPGGLSDARIPDEGVGSNFVGKSGPSRGERAYPGAPPTIPHATRMRSECTSCHGPSGKLGLRTPHLDRVSCTQCHAPSAALDQSPNAELLP